MKHFNNILIGGLSLLLSTTSIAQLPGQFFMVNALSPYFPITLNQLNSNPDCADDDLDGVCNNLDCAPNNATLPAKPGTPCNDNNEFTSNDRVQADGCTCSGRTELVDRPIKVDAGPDIEIQANESAKLQVDVLQQNTCTTTNCSKTNQLLVKWDMNDCITLSGDENSLNYAEFTDPIENEIFCAGTVTNGLYRNGGHHYCSDAPRSSKYGNALSLVMPNIEEFQDNHPEALRFDIVLDPNSDISRINKLEFLEKAPLKHSHSIDDLKNKTISNNYPTKYGIRILKGDQQIYKAINIPTGKSWSNASFDFSNEPVFEVTGTAVITVEILAYDPINKEGGTSIWDLDDIKVFGDCCTSRSLQYSRYLWSTGERTSSITVDQPGSYTVTVTDCNDLQAIDEIKVVLKEDGLSIIDTVDNKVLKNKK